MPIPNQRSGNSPNVAPHGCAAQSRHERSGCYDGPTPGMASAPIPASQPSAPPIAPPVPAPVTAPSGAFCLLLMCKISAPLFVGKKHRNVIMLKAGCLELLHNFDCLAIGLSNAKNGSSGHKISLTGVKLIVESPYRCRINNGTSDELSSSKDYVKSRGSSMGCSTAQSGGS